MQIRDGRTFQRVAASLGLLVIAAAGCSGHAMFGGKEFKSVEQPHNEIDAELPASIPATPPYAQMETYPLRVGDELAFTLSIDPQAYAGDYKVRVNDQVTVEYLHEVAPERRSRTMRVLPNGSIDLPMIGSLKVAGMTVAEVTDEVNERAKKFFKFPQIVIAVTETAQRAEELRRAFTSGFNNQSLTVVVNPDGTINLPEVGTVHVMYRTLPEVREEVQKLYAQLAPGVRVWPHLTQRAPDQIFVLGQVRQPGRVLLDRPTHVSQAIAHAGGYLLGSELHAVVLIRYREGCPRAVKLDLHSAIHQDYKWGHKVDLKDDILLADGDVIVVPRDAFESTDDMIRRVFTFGLYGVVPEYDITVGKTPLK
jgi:polysaccharide export outer membrane protein